MYTEEDAKRIGDQIGINWQEVDIKQFTMGINVELEHGTKNSTTNVTNDDPIMTGKIALAHLQELSDYYSRSSKIEEEEE